MAEPEKENTTAEPKSKKFLLDEEIGKEFLSSWKSMSVTEYDGMDFSFGAVGKGKKNEFNFDKLDMDFNLDGDFNKLSSFKVDMPDIDFSCPPKNTAKHKDENAEESSGGNGQRKKETFSFSFGFNEMDNFNFDSTLTKGEKITEKDSMTKEVASVKLDDQVTKIRMSRDFAAYDDNDKMVPATKTVEASHIDNSETGIAKLASMRTNFLEPAKFETKSPENKERACLDIKMNSTSEETDQQGRFLGQVVQRGPHAQNEDTMALKSDSEVPKETCSSSKTQCNSTGRDQNICDNMVNEDPPCPENLQLADPHASCTTKSQNNAKNTNLLGIGTFIDSMDCSEQGQDQTNIEDAPTVNSLKRTQSDGGQDKNLVKKLDLLTVNREPEAHQVIPINCKDSGGVCSKFFKRQGGNKSDKEPRLVQLGNKRANGININPAEEIRGSTCKDVGQESEAVNNFNNIPSKQTRGLNVGETSKIVSHTGKTGSLSSLSSTETSNASGVQTCVDAEQMGSSTKTLGNSRITSISNNKLYSVHARATQNLSSLSVLRAPGSAVKQLGSRTLAGGPLTKIFEENNETQRDSGKLMPHPVDSSEKERHVMLMPSLKRKNFETSNTSAVSYSPLKRFSESPVQSRVSKESSQKLVVSRQVCCENTGGVKSRGVLAENSPSQVEISTLKNMVDYEFTELVENDGNLEKAEAYTKELEDLCNMLKKKQDEAKELLVRAIVNNNHLLMLNHPIFERKIRNVQKFVSRLMAKAAGK